MAEELHSLLHNAGIQPPYVLAGHSMGGFVVRVFIGMYPDEVAGLALIDASHPEMPKRLPRTALWHYPAGHLLTAAREWLRPLGLCRLACDLGIRRSGSVPSARGRRADAAEIAGIKARCRETLTIVGNLGDLPLVVLTSNAVDPNDAPGSRQERGQKRFYPAWAVMQDELAELSTDSAHVVADHGGHHLNRDNPELVAQALISLVERVRSARQ